MRFLRNNALSQLFLVLFLGSVGAQSVAGWKRENEDQLTHGQEAMSYARYLHSSEFWQAVMENWQSEFLQFSLYIAATVYLVQRGSNESKEPGKEGLGSDEEQRVGAYAEPDSPRWASLGGFRQWLYGHSLLLVMTTIFFLCWFAQS